MPQPGGLEPKSLGDTALNRDVNLVSDESSTWVSLMILILTPGSTE